MKKNIGLVETNKLELISLPLVINPLRLVKISHSYIDFLLWLRNQKFDQANANTKNIAISNEIEKTVLDDAAKHRWNVKIRMEKRSNS